MTSNGQTKVIYKYLNKLVQAVDTDIFLNHHIMSTHGKCWTNTIREALQWCTTDDIPEDVISIDIAKCYPSILLNNKHEIPNLQYP